MSKTKITCDSTCDLTGELYERCGAEVMPLGVYVGEELKRDGVDIDPFGVFEYVDKTGVLPKTSAMSVQEYYDTFKKYTDQGMSVIHINISSEFSSCYQNACIAASELENVYVIDSRNLSSGSGHLVMRAHEMAQEGLPAAQIADELNRIKEKLDVSFVLQTLNYLQKGGRCPSVVALGANILKLRPEIEVINGKMTVGKKYRGSMEKSISDYVRGRLQGRDDIDTKRIFITHSHVPDELVAKVKELVKELQPFDEILETYAGCTVSSHCGPCCLGVLFFKK